MGRLHQLLRNFKEKKASYREYYSDEMPKIKRRNEELGAYLEIFEELVETQVTELESGKRAGRLAGLPLAIKDIISIQGQRLTAASKILENYRAPRSATVVERLDREGAVFVGRSNCDEFAMGSSNENSAYGPAKNPFDLSRSPGGSSGGSASAVAGELCVGALGTDTGGSIRLPAAFCGITGLKPTYGRVSRSGVIAFASSLDQVGPMADDALDCAEILQVISGADPRDSTAMKVPVEDFVKACEPSPLKDLKIGYSPDYLESESLPEAYKKELQEAKRSFEKLGAKFYPMTLEHLPYSIAAYYIIAPAEASSNLARYDGVRFGHRTKAFESLKEMIVQSRSEGFGDEVKRRIMIGSFALSSGYFDAYYSKAQFVRSLIQKEFLEAFKKVDLLFWPSSPRPPFPLGKEEKDPLSLYLADIFTIPVNLAGLPALSFPIGYDEDSLPIGAQLIGRAFAEAELLRSLAAYERERPFEKRPLACH
ncbi:MAG: Asp-tRNA(Asn)/Glu-tRNA(Gln) amidotransferase subunit GatA [Bradymonadales bacterium]|nr:MAG: Asp-tRNA(Asn)/Glu-tRNA(Gln) amidotransferase subunit GatA [Bradymonadales bacterium]